MPTLRFRIKDIEFEYIGEHKDMIEFIQVLMATPFSVTSLAKTSTKMPSATPVQPQKEIGDLRAYAEMPSNEEVLQYIVQKPDFQHTLFDVQEHFFGQHFSSRGKTLSMYTRTANQLKNVQAEIEKRYDGKFEKKRGKKRLLYYIFKKEAVKSQALMV